MDPFSFPVWPPFFSARPCYPKPHHWSLKNSSDGKHSLLHNFWEIFSFLFQSRSMFYTSSSRMTQLQCEMNENNNIKHAQEPSDFLCSGWLCSSQDMEQHEGVIKNCCISIWLWQRKEEQHPGAGLLQQGWFICLVIMTDFTPKCGKDQEEGDIKETQKFGNH